MCVPSLYICRSMLLIAFLQDLTINKLLLPFTFFNLLFTALILSLTKGAVLLHLTSKPLFFNIAKSVKYGLSGVLYHDDGQISELIVRKRIAAQGDGPRIEVELYKLEELV